MRIERQTPHTVEVAEFQRIAESLRSTEEWLDASAHYRAARTGSPEEKQAWNRLCAITEKFYMPKASAGTEN